MLVIRTGRVGDPGSIDITVKSSREGAGRFFAPSWRIVGGHKRWASMQAGARPPAWTMKYEPLDDQQYAEEYKRLLRARWKEYAPVLRSWLEGKSEVVLACYCRPGKFCHRDLAAEILLQICGAWGIEARVE